MRRKSVLPLLAAVLCFGLAILFFMEMQISTSCTGIYVFLKDYDDPDELQPAPGRALNIALIRLTGADKDAVCRLYDESPRKWAVINTVNRRIDGTLGQQEWLEFCRQGILPAAVPDQYVEPEYARVHREERKQYAARALASANDRADRAKYKCIGLVLLGGFFLYRCFKLNCPEGE